MIRGITNRRHLVNVGQYDVVQSVNSSQRDRGLETFYPGGNNRPTSFLYTVPKF